MAISVSTTALGNPDEYTGEILRDDLLQAAMIDELDDVNQHVWEMDTIEHMKTVPDYILVRSR